MLIPILLDCNDAFAVKLRLDQAAPGIFVPAKCPFQELRDSAEDGLEIHRGHTA